MGFDPATLLSRTLAGDAELSTPKNGLSLGQRKLLTYLDQPRALEELAAEHALLVGDKLHRDLTKLAALNLIAIDGQDARAPASTVVLGGARAPSMLRWLLPALLLVGGVVAWLGMGSPTGRKSEPNANLPTAPLLSTDVSSPSPSGATPVASSPITVANVSPPVATTAPAARETAMPMSTPTRIESWRPRAAVEPLNATRAESTPATAAGSKPVAIPAAIKAPVVADSANPAVKPEPVAQPLPATVPSGPSPSLPAADTSPSLPAVDTSPPRPMPPALAPTLAAAPSPTLLPAKAPTAPAVAVAVPAAPATAAAAQHPVATEPNAATKLAMAAPNASDAHTAAAARLVPLTREDPEFPREAIARGVSTGTVKARLSIDAAGRVTAVNIVDSSPGRVFDRAVTQALARWTFAAGVAGRSTEVEIAFSRD